MRGETHARCKMRRLPISTSQWAATTSTRPMAFFPIRFAKVRSKPCCARDMSMPQYISGSASALALLLMLASERHCQALSQHEVDFSARLWTTSNESRAISSRSKPSNHATTAVQVREDLPAYGSRSSLITYDRVMFACKPLCSVHITLHHAHQAHHTVHPAH